MQKIKHETRRKVIDGLEQTDEWVKAATVAARGKVSRKTTREHLHELSETGAVERREVYTEVHKWEFRYVQLPEWWDA